MVKQSISAGQKALEISRDYTSIGQDPMGNGAGLAWERRDAIILDPQGNTVFSQKNVEVPRNWSQTATNVVASKYFRGTLGTDDRENSVRQLITRVVDVITGWGQKGRYFAADTDLAAFRDELAHLLITQKAAFNSPVWFNVGIEKEPQCSACFINSVDDTMESILALAKTEGLLFKYGSGTGTNFSTLRASNEPLSGGGTASGPVSFMKGFDSFAGVIKSGGKTRRAAKMVILNVDHPDILDFIQSKKTEEEKAHALAAAGYDPGFYVVGGAYDSVQFQNANHSVRVTDEFMKAVEKDREVQTHSVTTERPVATLRAKDIWHNIAQAAWLCGDPGVQFDDTINQFHTCKSAGRIHASNPCSEYMFLDDTACNLASLNLLQFLKNDGGFDIDGFVHAISIMVVAQEIMVDFASYPNEKIRKNSHEFRPLGLGYANLGALLMALGLPYDSDVARALAAAVTALLTGQAYRVSAEMALAKGSFEAYETNRKSMNDVIQLHQAAATRIDTKSVPSEFACVLKAARAVWGAVGKQAVKHGFRNAQVTVLAPTGTIGFMMDCDTTGIEPELALVKYKSLVGGGQIKLVNQTAKLALVRLGYSEKDIGQVVQRLKEVGTIEEHPIIKLEHVPIFDCAFKPKKGKRFIRPEAHLLMMAAVGPLLSGGISKTVNLPSEASVEDIEKIMYSAWKMGLKSVAIYRDGCKITQPLSMEAQNRVEVDFGTFSCQECGTQMIRSGSCFECGNCGETRGCG